MKKFLLLFVLCAFIGCTNSDGARKILEAEGCTNIEITGYNYFGCSKDDNFHTGFTCTKNGKFVEGTVCEGFLKGKTIRYN